MKKLDKKQIPQFIALCVITSGLAGYVIMHLVAPGPVSAGTRIAAAPVPSPVAGQPAAIAPKPGDTPAGAVKPGDVKTADAADAANSTDAPPPNAAMHDPFAVGYVDPATLVKEAAAASASPTAPAAPALPKMPAGRQTASVGGLGAMPVSFPGAPALPSGLSGFPARPLASAPGLPAAPFVPALPSAPAPPRWTVTGVLQGAAGDMAILRSGEARRIVHSGDFVDSVYRVTGVTRSSVMLRHGTTFYQLTLGGAKAAPAAPSKAPAMPSASFIPAPDASQPAAVLGNAIIPQYRPARPKAPLAHGYQQNMELNLASESLAPAILPKPHVAAKSGTSPAKVADSISLGLRLLDGSVMAQDGKDH